MRRFAGAAVVVVGPALPAAAPAKAPLNVDPITWNAIGLDSNSPTVNPEDFLVGARVCNDIATTNVSVVWIWQT